MQPTKCVVTLSDAERAQVVELISAGRGPARKLTHARILLKADRASTGPAWRDDQIMEALDVSRSTVARVRERHVKEGLEAALNHRRPQKDWPHRLDGDQEAHLIALACSSPPEGRARWTLRLLADRMVELEYVESLSYETVRRTLKKTNSSPGARSNGVFHRKPAGSSSGEWRTFSMCTAGRTTSPPR
jgi:transposase